MNLEQKRTRTSKGKTSEMDGCDVATARKEFSANLREERVKKKAGSLG